MPNPVASIYRDLKYAFYLLVQRRPSESETIDKYLRLIEPVMELEAAASGYKILWGPCPIHTSDSHKTPRFFGHRVRRNCDFSSDSTIKSAFHPAGVESAFRPKDFRITIHNEIAKSAIIFSFEMAETGETCTTIPIDGAIDHLIKNPKEISAHLFEIAACTRVMTMNQQESVRATESLHGESAETILANRL